MMLKPTLTQKYWIFLLSSLLAGFYLFESTRWQWVSAIVEYKLDFAPIISVKNILAVIFIYLLWKIFVTGRN